MTKKDAFLSKRLQLQNHPLPFILDKNSIHSATSSLSPEQKSHGLHHSCFHGQANLNRPRKHWKIPRQIWVILLVRRNRRQLYRYKTQSFQERWQQNFRINQNITMGESVFHHFIQMSNQLVIAAKDFRREQILAPVQTPTMSKDMDEQLKLAHRVADFADRPNIKICVTMLRYSVDKPQRSYGQAPLLARK